MSGSTPSKTSFWTTQQCKEFDMALTFFWQGVGKDGWGEKAEGLTSHLPREF